MFFIPMLVSVIITLIIEIVFLVDYSNFVKNYNGKDKFELDSAKEKMGFIWISFILKGLAMLLLCCTSASILTFLLGAIGSLFEIYVTCSIL